MAASGTTSQARPHGSRLTPAIGTAALTIATLVGGDVALLAVVGVVRGATPNVLAVEWFVAAVVISVATFVLLGVPQVRLAAAGRTHAADAADGAAGASPKDRRTAWAVDRLRRGGPLAFAAASAAAGPLVIGWFAGRHTPDRAIATTAASALVFGAFWSAVYLGVLTALF